MNLCPAEVSLPPPHLPHFAAVDTTWKVGIQPKADWTCHDINHSRQADWKVLTPKNLRGLAQSCHMRHNTGVGFFGSSLWQTADDKAGKAFIFVSNKSSSRTKKIFAHRGRTSADTKWYCLWTKVQPVHARQIFTHCNDLVSSSRTSTSRSRRVCPPPPQLINVRWSFHR